MKNKTIQRKFILEFLRKNNNHSTAKEIFASLTPKIPQIGLSTIYRNLKLLEDEGFIKSIKFSSYEMRFDGNIEPHFHIICPICGKITDDYSNLYEQISAIIKQSQYSQFEIVFINKCGKCIDSHR